jgi:hypothetical protein
MTTQMHKNTMQGISKWGRERWRKMKSKRKKRIYCIFTIVTLFFYLLFLLPKIHWRLAQIINNNTVTHFLKYSYFNLGTLFLISRFYLIVIIRMIVKFIKRRRTFPPDRITRLEIFNNVISVIAYIVHLHALRYYLCMTLFCAWSK